MSIYSVRFAAQQVSAGGIVTVYTAPANIVSVLRDWRFADRSGNPNTFTLWLQLSGSTNLAFWAAATSTGFLAIGDTGRVVLNSGDQLGVSAGQLPYVAVLSGYQLS